MDYQTGRPSGANTAVIDRDQQLRVLQEHYAPGLRRYVMSMTGSSSEVDDIVQETLLRAWKAGDILDEEPEKVRPWLFKVARNLVIDRARSARQRHELTANELPEQPVADKTSQITDSMVVREALATLSESHRAIIAGAYYGGRNTAELAEELGIAEGTVKSRLHYGLRSLRLALQERGVDR